MAHVSRCKVKTFIPNHQIFSVKKYETLKNSCFSVCKNHYCAAIFIRMTLARTRPMCFFWKSGVLYNKVLKKIFS